MVHNLHTQEVPPPSYQGISSSAHDYLPESEAFAETQTGDITIYATKCEFSVPVYVHKSDIFISGQFYPFCPWGMIAVSM